MCICSTRAFNARSDAGSVVPPVPRFSAGFVRAAGAEYVKVSDDEVIAEALRILSERVVHSDPLESPRLIREYLAVRFSGLEHEVFACIYLDNNFRAVGFEELFRGTVNGTAIHPREVVKRALARNAAAVILAHNHPSGVPEPSQEDEMITRLLRNALALVDIRIVDHLIVAGNVTVSMMELGLL